ncbi:MAG: hypothetical protein ACTSWY_13605 [Promethearchaeota archaeon]
MSKNQIETTADLQVFSFLLGSILSIVKKEWKHKITITFNGLIVVFIGLGVRALAPPGELWIVNIGAFITLIPIPIFNTIIATNIQKAVPLDKRGRVFSINMAFSTSITPIVFIISGPISLLIGIRPLFLICSILGVITVILCRLFSNLNIYRLDETNSKIKDVILKEQKCDKQVEGLFDG